MLPSDPTLRYLYSLQLFGMKFGLRNIRFLMRQVGNPHRRFPSVHIAGTNGKGSTASIIASILTSAGFNVGLYTSPHLVHFNERIRINGNPIRDEDLIRYTKRLKKSVRKKNATFFEATTAIAFMYFADQHIDIAVVESGLGGRLDATNVLSPILSVITSIQKDHTAILGKTFEAIAWEKGGIMKPRIPCITGKINKKALAVLSDIAKNKSVPLFTIPMLAGNSVMQTFPGKIIEINASLAFAAIEALRKQHFSISPAAVRQGIRRVKKNTGLRGRYEILATSPKIILDVGHNPDAIKTIVAQLEGERYRELRLVFGVMADKDVQTMIRLLAKLDPIVYAVQPKTERALPATVICNQFTRLHCRTRFFGNVEEGIEHAIKEAAQNDLLLINGSFYVVGEALEFLRKKGRLKKA